MDGYDFAPSFSIWTTIEECLNPPVIWEAGRGWYVTEPFSEPEIFDFPGGIGPVECVNVEHEEVILMPRWVEAKRVTFKYGLGAEFIDVLRTLRKLGLDKTAPVPVRGTPAGGGAAAKVLVSPRDLVAACLPDPAFLGEKMHGATCAGVWVTGTGKDGEPREVYLYHVVDNQETMREYGAQCVVWQTAVNPVVALRAAGHRRLVGHRRPRPGGVPGAALPRPAGRGVRVAVGDGGAYAEPVLMARRAADAGCSSGRRSLLLLQMAVAMVTTAVQQTPMIDEPVYAGAAVVQWQQHSLRYNAEHPPLGKTLIGVGLAFAEPRLDPGFVGDQTALGRHAALRVGQRPRAPDAVRPAADDRADAGLRRRRPALRPGSVRHRSVAWSRSRCSPSRPT